MSSGDRTFGKTTLRAGRAALFAGFAIALALGGCGADSTGFRPLYATSQFGGAGASEKLAAMDVAPIPGRVGQRIRNELIFQSTGGGAPLPPEYRLDIAIREYVTATLVEIDGNATGQVYNLDASYKLVRISDKKVIAEGASFGRAGFQRLTSIFANVRAREDAENRAARTVGEELRTRLIAQISQAT